MPDLDSRSGFQIWVPDLDARSGFKIWIPDLDAGSESRQDRDPIIELEEFEEALASTRDAGGVCAPSTERKGPIGPGGRRPTKRAKMPKGPRKPKADWRATGTCANGANGSQNMFSRRCGQKRGSEVRVRTG